MKIVLFLICLYVLAFPVSAQGDANGGDSVKTTTETEKEILRLEELGRQKTLSGARNWDDLWADGAYLIAADGSVMNYLPGMDLTKGSPPPNSMTLSEMLVRVSGEVAIVTGLVEVGIQSAQNKPFAFKVRFINVWKKMSDGAWRITVAERTPIRPVPGGSSPVNTQSAQKKTANEIASDVDKRLRVERIPATNILYLETAGSYDKHPQIIGQLLQFAQRNYATAGVMFGIYPVDPDSVGVPFAKQQQKPGERPLPVSPTIEKKLVWGVAIRVIPGQPGTSRRDSESSDPFFVSATEAELTKALPSLKQAKSPFKLQRLRETTAIVLETDVNRSPADGLALNAWMVKNGYVQTGATRMEMAMNSTDPMNALAKIVIPAVKRKSGLSVK